MATIRARKRSDGSVGYYAEIRIKKKGEIIHRESRTFDKKRHAQEWARGREAELDDPKALLRVQHRGITVGQVLTWYRDDYDGVSKFGRSKLSNINALINDSDIADLDALELTSGQLMAFVYHRRHIDNAGPSTVKNDLIWLRNAWRAVRIGRDVPLDMQVIDDAAHLANKEKLIASSEQRDRRPSLDELEQLLEYFDRGDGRASIPMTEIALFALFSSRRQEEICRIRWDDLDSDGQRVLVRQMKHPRKKTDTWVALTDQAWSIIQRQPKTTDEIFPYNSRSVSAAFTRACKFLAIDDLRFHDLRHECTSWLFERGWDIPRVASVTGHRSWASLQRYTHLKDLGVKDRYEGWGRSPLVGQ